MITPAPRLGGKIALVTGAAHGLGRAIAARLIQDGARLVVADIDQDALADLATTYGSDAVPAQCDVTDPEAVQAAVGTATEAFGGLDIVVNNVGGDRARRLVDIEPEQWRRAMALNLDGVFYGIKYAAPVLADRGGGAIVNISSIAARQPGTGLSAYSTAKAAVEALTRAAALELRADGIRVNAVIPALFDTPGAQRSRGALERSYGADLDAFAVRRQGRWGRPEELAAVVSHLASDEASFTTGLLYLLDHGHTL